MTKIPHDDILEGLYKLRIRESEKLKTVFELYDLETQKKLGPDYHRLKTMVKRSIEQEIRNKNFGARSGNFEKTKQRVQRILGDCWQWETNGQCVKGNNCSFRHDMNKRGKSSPSNQKRLLEEVVDRVSVELVERRHRRHDERGSPGSHVTDRGCPNQRRPRILQDSRPRPRRWSVQCPWAVVRVLLHLLLLLAPRHHSRTSAVVSGTSAGVDPSGGGHWLCRRPHRVQPSATRPPAWVRTEKRSPHDTGQRVLVRKRLVVVVVVVVLT